ncbi:MAG: hypothetical protein ACR2KG_05805 [Nocardioidaceae bacterium]
MIGALKYEVTRIRTIASSYWLSALAVVFSAGIAVILCLVVNQSSGTELGDLAHTPVFSTWIVTSGASGPGMPVLAAAFLAVMGALAMGHEYRYGTNKATLTALPDRYAVLAAKAIVLTVWVAIVALLILLINTAIAWLLVSDMALDSESVRPMAFFVLYCIGFSLAGFGLAAILRSQVGSIVTVLVWPLAIEPIVFTILRFAGHRTSEVFGTIANFLPASAGRRSMFRPYQILANLDLQQTNIWGLGASTLVYWVGILILIVAGSVLFVIRDA